MNGLSDLLEFFEGMAQLWIDNRCGFIAVALYIFIFLTFLLLWVLGFMRGLSHILVNMTHLAEPVTRGIRGLSRSITRNVELSSKTKNGERELSLKVASPQNIRGNENGIKTDAEEEDPGEEAGN